MSSSVTGNGFGTVPVGMSADGPAAPAGKPAIPENDFPLASFTTREGKRVRFAFPGKDAQGRPLWDPQVDANQQITGPKPAIYAPVDYPFTDQMVALKDEKKMNTIAAWIEEHYGQGAKEGGKPAPKDIHHLTPLEAMELSRRILAERTEYDNASIEPLVDRRIAKMMERLKSGQPVAIEEWNQLKLDTRPPRDGRDVLDLLKTPDDQDVVCVNQAETMVVIFEALKRLQEKGQSRLDTTTVRLFGNTLDTDPLLGYPTGMLDGKHMVFRKPTGEMLGVQLEREAKPQEKFGEHDLGKGKMWILSPEEEKRVEFRNDERLFLQHFPFSHILVQFVTQDRKGTYHARAVNTTDESEQADATASLFMQEALQAWHRDVSAQELNKAHERLLNMAPERTYIWHDTRRNRPLAMLAEIREGKSPRKLTGAEAKWCNEALADVDNGLKGFFGPAVHLQDAEMALNICKLCTVSEDFQLAEKALKLSGDKDWDKLPGGEKMADSYRERVALAKKMLARAKEEADKRAKAGGPKGPKVGDASGHGMEALLADFNFPSMVVSAGHHDGEVPAPQFKGQAKPVATGRPAASPVKP